MQAKNLHTRALITPYTSVIRFGPMLQEADGPLLDRVAAAQGARGGAPWSLASARRKRLADGLGLATGSKDLVKSTAKFVLHYWGPVLTLDVLDCIELCIIIGFGNATGGWCGELVAHLRCALAPGLRLVPFRKSCS
eukprot:2524952-Pleurochrysis_carterae.AAC.1